MTSLFRPRAFPAAAAALAVLLCLGLAGPAAAQVVIGQTTGVTGNSALNVSETTLGARLWLDAVNSRGGVNGNRIDLRTLDDQGSADAAAANVKTLVEKDQVLALFMIRGTPQNQAVLPLLERYDIASIAPSTGAMLLYAPVNRHVFNVRSPYQAEAQRAIEQLASMGTTRIAVFKTRDAFGEDASAGATHGFAKAHLEPVLIGSFDKAAPQFNDLAIELNKANAQAVLILGTGSAVVKAVREIRRAGSKATVVTLSNNASDGFVHELGDLARGVIVTQVFPGEDANTVTMVRDAAALLHAHHPQTRLSPAMIEGFAGARVLVEALRRAGAHPTRKSVLDALNGLESLDLGGIKLHYSLSDHSGLHYTDLSVIDAQGRFQR
jgi:branched-chain amino acid transport system substrate-binding protein